MLAAQNTSVTKMREANTCVGSYWVMVLKAAGAALHGYNGKRLEDDKFSKSC
jgi:hypothetical protein